MDDLDRAIDEFAMADDEAELLRLAYEVKRTMRERTAGMN
jgi:hypothetical protein